MSWRWYRYFKHEVEYDDVLEKFSSHYEYMDKSVKVLPADIPMPPTDDFTSLFSRCEKLQDISALANWDVYNIKNMCGMFGNCKQLQDLTPLANWDISRVEDTICMFCGCEQLQDLTPLANWDVSKVKDMAAMFYDCKQLENITALSNWKVTNGKSKRDMFRNCKQLKDISALANWGFHYNDKEVFYGCTLLPQELQTNPFYMHTYLSKQV